MSLRSFLHKKSVIMAAAAVVAVGFFGAASVIYQHKVAAAGCTETLYFSGASIPCSASGHDVDQGHFSTSTSKATFINEVESSSAEDFYVALMIGSHRRPPTAADIQSFEDRVNNPDIAIKVVNSSALGVGCNNSMSYNGDYAFICDTDDFASLVLYSKSTGANYTIIKINCGNPLNGTPLPESIPNAWTASGSSAVYSDSGHTRPVSSVVSGSTVYFRHKISTAGTGPVLTGSGTVYGKWSTTPLSGSGSGGTSLGAASYPRSISTVYTNSSTGVNVPNAYIAGNVGYYCQYISYTSGSAGGTSYGDFACVSVTKNGVPPPPPPSGGLPCPGDPSASVNAANHPLSLPATAAYSTGNVSGFSGVGGARTGYGYEPSGHYTVNSVSDNYGQATSFTGAAKSTGPFTADYNTYLSTYPYDNHAITAYYTVWYNQYEYQSSTTPTPYCPNGGGVSGNSCATSPVDNPTCDSPGVMQRVGCEYLPSAKEGWQPWPMTDHWSCPNGGRYNGSVCYIGPVSIHYAISKVAAPVATDQTSQTTSAAQSSIGACYDRNFKVNSTDINTGATLSPTMENPNTGSSTNPTIVVTFWGDHGGTGFRTGFKLSSLGYTGTINGSNGLTCSGTVNGSFSNITVASSTSDVGTSTGPFKTSPLSATVVTCSVAQPAPLGGTVCAQYKSIPGSGTVNIAGNITSQGGDMTGSQGCSYRVINMPYLKVFGGDVAAGIGFMNGATCTSSNTATIRTFNTGLSPLYSGSGTNLAALAVKPIETTGMASEGFASAQAFLGAIGVTNSSAPAPRKLSFGNNELGHLYGGNYGASTTNCSPDYANAAPAATASNSLSSGAHNLSSLGSGIYVATGPLSLWGPVNSGHAVVIYSNGYAVTITGNVTFGSAATIENLPSFSLIVSGADINIGPSVTQVAGNYIAQGGTIDDCNTSGDIYRNCGAKLTVNGSFVANNIDFYRMGDMGSLRFSILPTADAGPGLNNASEEFDYSPANWLAIPPPDGKPPAYDAVTSLPPVL